MKEKIASLFSSIASSYDRMNDVMSFGQHTFWKAYFVEQLPWGKMPNPFVYLDMSCGSGDIGSLVLQKAGACSKDIVPLFVDPNPDMMVLGQEKVTDERIEWRCESAEDLTVESERVDLYTISFGLRNVSDRGKALAQAFRVLTKGGAFFCLEFSHPSHPVVACAYHTYLQVLPLVGKIVAGQSEPYSYLGQSIRDFPSPVLISMELAQAGFKNIGHHTLSSGIVAIHWGYK
jgi:ubiquinone/menaquinone biosynthesis methyltransferase